MDPVEAIPCLLPAMLQQVPALRRPPILRFQATFMIEFASQHPCEAALPERERSPVARWRSLQAPVFRWILPTSLRIPFSYPQPWSCAQQRAVLTFSTVLLSEDGVRPDHKANLQGSPSTCSVTPSSEVCRQEMPVRGGEGEGSGET